MGHDCIGMVCTQRGTNWPDSPMVKDADYESEGREFKSRLSQHFRSLIMYDLE